MKRYTYDHLIVSNKIDTPLRFESGGLGLAYTIDDYARFAKKLNVKMMQQRTQAAPSGLENTERFLCGALMADKKGTLWESFLVSTAR